jgi:cellulose synthase/poly-beta-1,6-N-acetylglucosamine synthase-like glycosyltransferase
VGNGPTRPLADPAPSLRHSQPEPAPQARPELTRPPGVALIVTGTVLLLAVSIPLPFLNVKLVGLIMIVAGVVNVLTRPPGMVLITTGTVLLLAVSIPLPLLNVKLLGLIMIVAWLVKVRALQRAFGWLWRNRRMVTAARVPLDPALATDHPGPGPMAARQQAGPGGLVGPRNNPATGDAYHQHKEDGAATLFRIAQAAATTQLLPLIGGPDVPRHSHGDRLSDPDGGGPRHDGYSYAEGAAEKVAWPPQPGAGYLSATVLIPAHNEAETIAALVQACVEQPYPLDDIIVVADSCTDNTALAAELAGATIVLEVDFQDKASSQNAALFDIHSDLVVGFDGDTIPEPGCIETMIADIRDNNMDATCATILPIQPRGFWIRARRFAYALGRRWWRLCQARVGRIQVLTGACYVFKTEAIKSVGGFPNGLISADMDATWALHKAGYKLGYAGNAIALTYDPDTYRVYRDQMRRWSSGYFQNMAKYRRQLLNWRSMLVVWTALFDLCALFAYEIMFILMLALGHYRLAASFGIWMGIHAVVTTFLVATVVGWKEALLGYFPYLCVNYYNKWLYLCAFVREWILGRHYSSWTGRQGRKTVITPMTARRKLTLSCILVVLLGAAGCATAVKVSQHPPTVPVATGGAEATPSGGVRYLGVVTPGASVAQLDAFASLTGSHPNMDEYYAPWGQPFSVDKAADLAGAGALPLISWEPTTIPLRAIASGISDAYIRSWAQAVMAYGRPLAISFAAEMNGDWERWGPGFATPAQFVAAWRHIHDLFTAARATNVTWVWTPNVINGLGVQIAPYWPGGRYVSWVGMDGYWWGAHRGPGTTFASIFGPTMQAVRTFTGKPFLIAETGGLGRFRQVAVRDLFAGTMHTPGVLGFVWFDGRIASQGDFRLETDPAAVVAFRQGVASMRAG